MKQFPTEFEALLSAKGKQVLRGKHAACGVLAREKFFSADDLLDTRKLAACTKLISEAFTPVLKRQVTPLPPANSSKEAYETRCPRSAPC